MCTIILKRANGAKITIDQIYAALQYNSDGFGAMWYKDSKLVTYKYDNSQGKITDSADFIFKLINSLDEYAMHFRLATHGTKSRANCHPFTFNSKKSALMHNGVLPKAATLSDNGRITDTLGYIRAVITPSLRKNKAIDWELVGLDIGAHNKFVVAENGGFTIVNGMSGVEHDGNWYSNYDAILDVWPAMSPRLKRAGMTDVNSIHGANFVLKSRADIDYFKRDLLDILEVNGVCAGITDVNNIQDAELMDIVAGCLGYSSAHDCLYSDEYGEHNAYGYFYDTYGDRDYF